MLTSDFEKVVGHYLPHHDKAGEKCPTRVSSGVIQSGRLLLRGVTLHDQRVVTPWPNITFPWTPQRARLQVAVFNVVTEIGYEFYDVLRTDTTKATSIIYDRLEASKIRPGDQGIVIPGPSREDHIFIPNDPTTTMGAIGSRALDPCQIGIDEKLLINR